MRQNVTAPVLAVLAALACAGPAGAQNMTADQIIRSLRPTGPSGTTRGIRPVGPSADAPATPATPSATPSYTTSSVPPSGNAARVSAPTAQPMTPPRTAQAPSVNLTVQFATGSAELTPAATRTLDELGRALTSNTLSGYHYRIEGHTDTVGTPDSNKMLSDQRAAKVLDYLATKWNVDRSKFEAVGMGQDQLLVRTGPNVASARNRRVTVVNLGT